MKKILLAPFLLAAIASCKMPKPKPATIYTVIIDSQLADNHFKHDTLNLPASYIMCFDSTKNGWSVAFRDQYEDTLYLSDGPFNIVFLYHNHKYADVFPHAGDAAKLALRHWQEILDDRASHQKGGKP